MARFSSVALRHRLSTVLLWAADKYEAPLLGKAQSRCNRCCERSA